MKQTIIIHGSPDNETEFRKRITAMSEGIWIPWLKRQLELIDESAQALEMPKPYDIVYEDWVATFEQMKVNSETTLIGHSCGGGFLVRYLGEHSEIKPKQIILVAPWIDPNKEDFPFFDFTIDSSLSGRVPLHIFISSNDQEQVMESCKIIKGKLPNAIYHELGPRGHFEEKEFPELLELLK